METLNAKTTFEYMHESVYKKCANGDELKRYIVVWKDDFINNGKVKGKFYGTDIILEQENNDNIVYTDKVYKINGFAIRIARKLACDYEKKCTHEYCNKRLI